MSGDVWLKGEGFQNRYRLQGTLTTKSPLHVGCGAEVTRPGLVNEKTNQPVKVSAIATNHLGRPYVPGSSIKGVLRSYLLDVFRSVSGNLAALRDFDGLMRGDQALQKQENQIRFIKEQASALERLFGTPFAEGKLDVWDARCKVQDLDIHPSMNAANKPPYWDAIRMTTVDQSVAIDPDTHTAIDKKLYHYEVVPPGVSFELNVAGQNLSPMELGMLLFCLEAFNSEIWPPRLGAMGNRGLGSLRFQLDGLYRLTREMVPQWVKEATNCAHAGYQGLHALDQKETEKCVQEFKEAFLECIEGGSQ